MPTHPTDDSVAEKGRTSATLDEPDASDAASDAGALSGSEKAIPAALFAAIAVAIGIDVALDLVEGVDPGHLLLEGSVFALAAGGFVWLWLRMARARRALAHVTSTLDRERADAARFRAETRGLLEGLGAAIERQFQDWQLSSAEREVGLLLLKGLSLREIAEARGTSERTVRQQANAVYRKADVAGRAALSAFFLEDLLLPHQR